MPTVYIGKLKGLKLEEIRELTSNDLNLPLVAEVEVTALSITVVLLVDEDVLSASLSLLLANKFVELLLDAGL